MIGVHRNQGGDSSTINPVGDYVARLRDAGLRPFVVVIGEGGHAAELSDAGAEVAFAKDDWRFAPNYESNNPAGDAAGRWQLIKEAWPPELSKEAWCVVLNEPRKEAADYVHRFMVEFAKIANADGHRVTGPNWSVGTPEVDAWETDAGRAWLRYCGEHPDMASLGLHEYSLNAAELESGAPWLIGRYQFILDVCDDHDIPHPRILICECGWVNDDMPDAETALAQVPFLHATYGDIDVALWTLGGWSQGPNLPPKLAAFMPLLTDWLIANVEPPDEEPPVNPIRELWEQSVQFEQDTGINFNPKFAFIKWAADNGYSPVHRERAMLTSDGARWNAQAFRDLRGEKPRVLAFYEQPWGGMGKVQFVTADDLEPEPGPDPDPTPQPFSFRAWPTDYKTVTQTFGARPDYYGQFGLPGHEGEDVRAPNGSPVYAVDDGVVYLVTGNEGNYGRQIRIDHGNGYKSVYAHNLENMVQQGQRVIAGQQIARADSTGNSSGSHLHLTLKRDGHSAPGYPNGIVDPTVFAMPHRPDWPGLPPSVHGLTVCDVSQHQGAISFSHMMRRGVYGCYIRGSIGGSGLDDRFATNWQNIKDTPMLRGMYHLFRSDSTAEQNLANIVKVVNQYGGGDLRIAIDVEPLTNLPRINGDRVKRLLELFRDSFGYEPLIYTGLWVQDRVDGDKSWFASSLLWLASYWQAPPQVGQYPQLPLGGNLDRLLMHQWTSSYFDGRSFGVQSSGLDVNLAYNLDHLLIGGTDPKPPPPKVTVDLLGYMMPSQARGPLYELRREDGSQERVQTHVEGSSFYYVKGSGGLDGKGEWEELTFDSEYIFRGKDTSPRPGEWYALRDDIGAKWSKWAPRRMGVGDSYLRNPWVVFFRKDNCEEVSRGQQRTTITLEAVHAHWTSPHGITLKDVIAVVVRHADGGFFERTYFAKGYGLVGFEGETVKGYISELHEPGQRPDQQREQGCFS